MLKYILLALVAVAILGAIFVRLRPLNPDDYTGHLQEGFPTGNVDFPVEKAGSYLQSVDFTQPVDEVAAKLRAIIEATPRTTLMAGSLAAEPPALIYNATYVTRSALWGFPDVTTVEVAATNRGAAVTLYGRLVYGKADMGVNKARIEGWLEQLSQ